jgi:hypothetical protein
LGLLFGIDYGYFLYVVHFIPPGEFFYLLIPIGYFFKSTGDGREKTSTRRLCLLGRSYSNRNASSKWKVLRRNPAKEAALRDLGG